MTRWVSLVLLLALLSTVGCKKSATPTTAAEGEAKPIPPPKSVMMYLGLRNPSRTIDEALALATEFLPLPLTRGGLLDLFAQRAGLPNQVVDAVDVTGALWMVGLDERQVEADPDPLVMVLPLKSRQAFEKALGQKLVQAGTEGKLTVYKPKPGAVGTREVKLLITDTHVWTASSARAFDLARPFMRGTLLPKTPDHDVELHFVAENILAARGDDLDRKVDQAMDKMRSSVDQRPTKVDRRPVVRATERTIRRWIDALKSTREVQLTLDVNKEQLTVALRGVAAAKGRLKQIIQRQRPGQPLGHALLPGASWVVFADHGNPEAQAEDRKTWEPLMRTMLKSMAPQRQEQLIAAVTEAMGLFTGDYTVALHRPPTGSGVTCSMVSRVRDAARAVRSMDRVEAALGAWIKAMIEQSGEKVPRGTRVDRKPFSAGKATGALFELHLEVSGDKRARLERILGMPVVLGVAFAQDQALLTLGRGAEQQLRAMATASGPIADGLGQNPAFEHARSAGAERVGLLYVSLVDLLRGLEGTGLRELETIGAALKEARVTAAPSVDWGVDRDRSALDITLRLPAAHFRAFKPILNELQSRGGLQGLLGGQKAPE